MFIKQTKTTKQIIRQTYKNNKMLQRRFLLIWNSKAFEQKLKKRKTFNILKMKLIFEQDIYNRDTNNNYN